MKNVIILVIVVLLGCFGCKSKQTESINLRLDGFWFMSSSIYQGEKTSQQANCPATDALIEDIYHPYALGTHLLVKEDSISLFYYPYEYYGTFKYKIVGDSLLIKSNYTSTNIFIIQNSNKDTFTLNFEESFTSTCLLSAQVKYKRLNPDSAIINKLLQDSISCSPLIGKWWYLRKEIHYEDGTEPTILNFPQGMPDSIFVSQELINQDAHKPFITLKLNHRMVKMFFKKPSKHSYRLTPKFKSDAILFSNFIDYGKYTDTIYHDVIYQNFN